MTNMTINGCAAPLDNGNERYEYFLAAITPRKAVKRCQYDYRASNGELFSCVKRDLDECRMAKDKWLEKKSL